LNTYKNREIKLAFQMTLPVLAGYVFLGITFGLLTLNSGLDWWLPIVMSLVIYSGALEFAAIPILTSTFDPISAVLLGITLSARHLFYGIPMLKKYDGVGKSKPFLIFGLTDETFSILSTATLPCDVNSKKLYLLVTLFDYLYWVSGTAMGALLGNAVKIDLQGLEFVLTALFVVLFIEQIKNKSGLKSGLIGLVGSGLALILFDSSVFVIVSMLFIILVLILGRRIIDRE